MKNRLLADLLIFAVVFLGGLALVLGSTVGHTTGAAEGPWRVVEVEGVSCIAHGHELVACDWGAVQ